MNALNVTLKLVAKIVSTTDILSPLLLHQSYVKVGLRRLLPMHEPQISVNIFKPPNLESSEGIRELQ